MVNIFIDILIGVASSLAVTLLLYFGFFEPLRKRVYIQIDRLINPVEEFRDIKDLARLIKHGIDSYQGDYSRLLLLRCLPCELSDGLVDHIYGDNEAAKHATRQPLLEYQELINRIIREGVGSFDESIFGRTNIRTLDENTLNVLKTQYFLHHHPPDTTSLGLNKNLNEVGVILLGETEDPNNTSVVQWKYGYLIVFSGDFKKIRGFMYKVNTHIDNLKLVFEQRKSDSQDTGLFFAMTSSMSEEAFEEFRGRLETFYKTKDRG